MVPLIHCTGEERVKEGRVLDLFFFSCHNSFPRHCSTQALTQELYTAKSSGLQGSGRRGHCSRCSIVWRSSPQLHSIWHPGYTSTSAPNVCSTRHHAEAVDTLPGWLLLVGAPRVN